MVALGRNRAAQRKSRKGRVGLADAIGSRLNAVSCNAFTSVVEREVDFSGDMSEALRPTSLLAGGVYQVAESESIQPCVANQDVETHGLAHEFLQCGLLFSAYAVFDTVTRSG